MRVWGFPGGGTWAPWAFLAPGRALGTTPWPWPACSVALAVPQPEPELLFVRGMSESL